MFPKFISGTSWLEMANLNSCKSLPRKMAYTYTHLKKADACFLKDCPSIVLNTSNTSTLADFFKRIGIIKDVLPIYTGCCKVFFMTSSCIPHQLICVACSDLELIKELFFPKNYPHIVWISSNTVAMLWEVRWGCCTTR